MNKSTIQKFAIWTHRELIQLAQKYTNETSIIEQLAYTWFRQLLQIHYMDTNGYLPPDIQKEYSLNPLSLLKSNYLPQLLPSVFPQNENPPEYSFPEEIIQPDGIFSRLKKAVPTEFWKNHAQIVGWLYQFFNTESKENIFLNLKNNTKITKTAIPVATQLFTPDWIVRYMVENSLGRLFINNQCTEKNESKRIHFENKLAKEFQWHYYIPEAKQTFKLKKEQTDTFNIEQLRIIDPCVGCGHILVYVFDILIQIYQKLGIQPQEATAKILNYHIFGLDIDGRAAELARFAIMMKARHYDSDIFQKNIQLNIHEILDSNLIFDNLPQNNQLENILKQFHNAKEFGSIIKIQETNFHDLKSKLSPKIHDKISPILKIAQILAQKYDVVITNPPYMGGSKMNPTLADYVKKNYPDSKSDLFAVFMERCAEMTRPNGFQSMITQHSWMFLTNFENLRRKIQKKDIVNLIHLGPRAFEEIGGEVVQTVSFILRNSYHPEYTGTYCNLLESTSSKEKERDFFKIENRYNTKQKNFAQIPNSPIAYWLSAEFTSLFQNGTALKYLAKSKQGLATADNQRFLRYWHEITPTKINFHAESLEEAVQSKAKWFPYNKGGAFRKWYGNHDYVINWENDGNEIRNFCDQNGKIRSYVRNPNYYFRECASWSLISTGTAAFRYRPAGQIFDVAGMSFFSHNHLFYLLALCNSKVGTEILRVIAPTINFQCGDIANIPVLIEPNKKSLIEKLVSENIHLAQEDWDSFETSWEFKKHPLL